MHAHTRTQKERGTYQGNGTGGKKREKKGFRKETGFRGRLERTDRGRMTDRNRELVPDSWSLVRERGRMVF